MIAIAMLGIGWTALFIKLNEDKRSIENTALKEAADLSKNYANHLSRTLEAINQIILHAQYEWELTQGSLQLDVAARRGLFSPGSVFRVAILDRNGFIATSTFVDIVDPARSRSLADRLYFQIHKNADKDFLYIGTPSIGPITGANAIRFTRRLANREGSFNGIVLVNVASEYFTANYDDTILGTRGFLGMVGADGIVRVTRTGQTIHTPQAQALVAIPGFKSPQGSMLLNGNEWFIDKRSRYVGWQAVKGYPMIALVGLDQQDILAPYWAARASSVRFAIAASLALAMFALIVMHFSFRLTWRKHQFELIQIAYRKATEVGNEGFYIIRPVHSRGGVLRDFELIDCNHRGAEFFHSQRRDLIGRKVSSLYSGDRLEGLMKRLRRAMAFGYYESEIEIPAGGPLRARWVHLKIVRSDNSLALTVRDISDTKSHSEELERYANEDALTGMPNRHWAQSYLPVVIQRAAASRSMLALLFVDLDGFKSINDTLGHAAGDEVLRIAAQRLKHALGPQDHVVRWGAEEFVIIIESDAHRTHAERAARRVQQTFDESFYLAHGMRTLGASIGISLFPDDGTEAGTLLRNADIAMHSAKRAGRNNYRFFEPDLYEALKSRLDMEHAIRQAIERDEFIVHYQPRVDMQTGRLCSMEALVRWQHPAKGLMGPLEFIPLAEETSLILDLGEIVLAKVCQQLACWGDLHLTLVPVSVNVSPRQFAETDIAAMFSRHLERHGIDPALIEVEVTESLMMSEGSDIFHVLDTLREMGVKLCIDDFGTGYSSLSQLQRLDFDVLKIDRAFISEIEKTEAGKVFVTAIITMAHALGMRVVAEGVETGRQVEVLKSLQCDEIQGFYLSRPLPQSEMQPIFARQFFHPDDIPIEY